MRRRIAAICVMLLVFSSASMVAAMPIKFDIAGIPDSPVEIKSISTSGWIRIYADIVGSLDDEKFSLNYGESCSFDVFTAQLDRFGWGTADITATLAFDKPDDIEVTGNGDGWSAAFYREISGGCLARDNRPQNIILGGGDYFDIGFESLCLIGIGVSAKITAHVMPIPEPANMLLFGIGLIGLAGFGRKKLFNQ